MRAGARVTLAADSCGCAMGARFMAVGLLSSAAWYVWQWQSAGLSLWSISWRIMLISFAAAAAGKIVGMIAFRITNGARPRSQAPVLQRGSMKRRRRAGSLAHDHDGTPP